MQEGKLEYMTDTNRQEKDGQEEMTLDQVFKELDILAERLEDSATSLEDSFRFYKKGMELLKYCNEKLDTVEKKMLQMDEDGTLREF